MGISEFFNSIAANFRNHYLELARNSAMLPEPRAAEQTDESEPTAPETTDTFKPSIDDAAIGADIDTVDPELAAADDPLIVGRDDPAMDADDADNAAEEASLEPYRFRHLTHLNYEVRLEFQLRAVAQLAQEIADGEMVSSEELFAGGFGLNAAMDFSGMRIDEAYGAEGEAVSRARGKEMLKAGGAEAFSVQQRNFGLETFAKESLKVKRTMHANASEKYQRAVNKFSLRYRMDNQFSFAYLNQFNLQTQRMVETDPANVEGYVDSAGNVAERGTTEMMEAFFGAVDAYLDRAEEDLLARAGEYLNAAAEQLGLSEASVEFAMDNIRGTIESFFAGVNESVEALESTFLPERTQPAEIDVTIPEAIDYYRSPKPEPAARVVNA